MRCGTLITVAVVFGLAAAQAHAETLTVRPGPNAIQKAVNKADPGDKLVVKRGKYREDVQVDKRLRIVGKRGQRPVIDGDCETDVVVDVAANGVLLKHLKVMGARSDPTGYTVNLVGVESGTLRDLAVRESCNGDPAYYGVNVFNTGALKITGLRASGGFVDAGIYVGEIGDVGSETFLIARNDSRGNNVGILIEDSEPEANIVVRRNVVNGNDFGNLSEPAGILVRRSDGGRYAGNHANRNGDYGIHLDPDSDGNRVLDNAAHSNGAANFLDEGSGNCGSGNSFPIDPC